MATIKNKRSDAYATQEAKLVQKTDSADDLRVRRTRKMLQDALIELTVEKGFAAITVRDLTERAMVNRSTFYRHYLDKYDLMHQYMDEVYDLVSDEEFIAEKLRSLSENERVAPGLVRMLEHIQQFSQFYLMMLGPKGDATFIQRFRQNTEKRFRVMLEKQGVEVDPKKGPLEMRLSYISCAGIGGILWWLENGQPCTPVELASWLSRLSAASVGLPFWTMVKSEA